MMHRLELLKQLEEEGRAALLKVVDNYLTTAQLQTTHKKLNKKSRSVERLFLFLHQD